jgi:hypothetical protein
MVHCEQYLVGVDRQFASPRGVLAEFSSPLSMELAKAVLKYLQENDCVYYEF